MFHIRSKWTSEDQELETCDFNEVKLKLGFYEYCMRICKVIFSTHWTENFHIVLSTQRKSSYILLISMRMHKDLYTHLTRARNCDRCEICCATCCKRMLVISIISMHISSLNVHQTRSMIGIEYIVSMSALPERNAVY